MAQQKVKTCKKCGVEKEASLFYKSSVTADKLEGKCIECRLEQNAKYRDANRHTDAYKLMKRNTALKMKYGITAKEYDQRKEAQDHKCGICKTELQEGKSTHLDHNHDTGKLRGILCGTCNRALGYFQDDINILEKARNYLQEHSHA